MFLKNKTKLVSSGHTLGGWNKKENEKERGRKRETETETETETERVIQLASFSILIPKKGIYCSKQVTILTSNLV